MEELKNKLCNFVKGKNFLVVIVVYIFCVIIFDLVLGTSTENLWDKLIKSSKNK